MLSLSAALLVASIFALMQGGTLKGAGGAIDETESLEKSGRLITSAAAIMVSVFAAFALADVVI